VAEVTRAKHGRRDREQMPDILKHLESKVLVIDGAFGTMLQRYEIPAEQCPTQLNVTAPEMVTEIHHNYHLAGADCATTNTFGGSPGAYCPT